MILGGKYQLATALAKGGTSTIYEVAGGPPPLVAKLGNGVMTEDLEVARFSREARVLERLKSEHIVLVLDTGVQDGRPFLIMERLLGEDLRTSLRRCAPLGERTAIKIAARALRGLAVAHDLDVLHRDVKPGNLFVCFDPSARSCDLKLLDFGVAKELRPDASILTGVGQSIGTPRYMSPEQLQGVSNLTPATDLYSTCAVLFECLTGAPPHADAAVGGPLLLARSTRMPQDPRTKRPELSPTVCELVMRGLQIDPAARYKSALSLLEALDDLGGSEELMATELGL